MKNEAIIDIIVSPRSFKSEIVVDERSNIKAFLSSPPIDGKANTECIKLFSKKIGIAKSRIKIVKGFKGREKRIVIRGMSIEDVMKSIKG